MITKKLSKWEMALILVVVIVFLFSILNFSFSGVSSYVNSLILLGSLCIFSFKKFPILALTFATLFIIELGLSIYSPYKSYAERNGGNDFVAPYFNHPKPSPYKPGTIQTDQNPEFNFVHKYNNIGFKDASTTQTNYHAFVLGDSFVQGVGTDSLNTFDKILENNLACKHCILNLGLSGSELINNLALLKQINESGYASKYVILNFNETDINDLFFGVKSIPELKQFGPSNLFQYLYGCSFIFRHICHDTFQYNWNLLTKEEEEILKPKIVDIVINYFLAYEKYAEETNSEFILVFQPMLHECQNKNYLSTVLIERLKKENTTIKFVDLSTLFEDDCEAYFWPIDMHFNTLGYQKYGKELFLEISKIDTNFIK